MGGMYSRVTNLWKETAKEKDENAVRIGILGAAKIAPAAVIWPARKMDNVVIAAVAARNVDKATKFAKKYGIPTVHGSYEELLEDTSLDAIYNPLPNGYHSYWTARALQKGFHVLCEKPMCSSAAETETVLEVLRKSTPKDNRAGGSLLVEAFHYRFHPVASRMREIVESGELGKITSISTRFLIPVGAIPKSDIRYNDKGTKSELAGGALMDAGCYAINVMRLLAGKEPQEVLSSKIVEAFENVDKTARATFAFEDGSVGKIEASLGYMGLFSLVPAAVVKGEKATLYVSNFLAPFVYHNMSIVDTKSRKRIRSEKHYDRGASTYQYQLEAFVGAIQGDAASIEKCNFAGSPEDSLKNMKTIDAVYEKAGLTPRRGKPLEL